jgi:hypothetical protein
MQKKAQWPFKYAILLLIAVFAFVLIAYISVPRRKPLPLTSEKAKRTDTEKFSFEIIAADQNTYAYNIYSNGKLLIHQPSIPGLPGNRGFRTREDAEKVAKVIIDKIKKGLVPPGITQEEMKNLSIIY